MLIDADALRSEVRHLILKLSEQPFILINGIASFGRFSSDLSDNLHPTLTATMLVTGTLKHDRSLPGCGSCKSPFSCNVASFGSTRSLRRVSRKRTRATASRHAGPGTF